MSRRIDEDLKEKIGVEIEHRPYLTVQFEKLVMDEAKA
jgi:hypothetical protein